METPAICNSKEKHGFSNRAFTLTELSLAIVVIGILAAVSLAQYGKAIEIYHAELAKAAVLRLAHANRARNIDGKPFVTGSMPIDSALVSEKYVPQSILRDDFFGLLRS